MFCVWNKFTNREGQLYGFFSSLCLFLRGDMPRKKQNAWIPQQVRDDGGMGGGSVFSALYACF